MAPHLTAPRATRNARLMVLAALLLAAQLAVRGLVAWHDGFYWDDLVLEGRAGAATLASALLQQHDGHFMPAAFLLAGAAVRLDPLGWLPVLAELLLLQAAASLAVLRLLRLILGWRPITVALFAWYASTPLTVPSASWWSAALNALPLHAGLAWAAGETILLARGVRNRARHEAGALLGFAAALLFFEKALLIPFAATGIAALFLLVAGHREPIRTTLRRGRRLWLGNTLVVAAWASAYSVAAPPRIAPPPLPIVRDALWRTNVHGFLPSAFGGPLAWTRQPPASALAHPPGWFALASALCAALLVAGSFLRSRHAAPVWLLFLGYLGACEASLLLWRTHLESDSDLGLSLRYTADSAVVLVAALALLARSARRRQPRPGLLLAASVCVCCASLVSTAAFARTWTGNPTNAYLDTARRELAKDQTTPLLDQPVPYDVLSWISYPDNLMSHVFASVRERPPFASSTPVLRFVDDHGHLVPGQVSSVRAIGQGPDPGCGYRVSPGETAWLPLSGALAEWEWTAQLNYFASADGLVSVRLPSGQEQNAPVHAGIGTVFVRLDGGGGRLLLRLRSPGLTLCVGAGPVGSVWPQ